ncbi:MAG: clostripain-related cysteine peptidase [Odoribacter sp.]|nr:clostripain-related cysteine peptidase [Odoribacter sp.]
MRFYFFIGIFLLDLVACHKDDSVEKEGAGRTIIVYLGVDNNFSGEGAEKIKALTEGWRGNYHGNLLVYADGGAAVLVRIHENGSGEMFADTLREYGAENSADPAVLKRVLSEVKEQFPADSYGMIVLSHGSGWLPKGQLVSPVSIIQDRYNEMEFPDFVDAIPMMLDFIVFDACFMGTIEVAYELKEKAKYVVASPAEVLSPGFVYKSMIGHLMTSEPRLTAVAKEFYDYFNGMGGFWKSATVSVVKTDELERVAEFLAGVGDVTDSERVNLREVQQYGYGPHSLFWDMGDYVSRWAPEHGEEFVELLNRAILYKAATPGYYSSGNMRYNNIHTYSGLAMYVPQADYPLLNREFRRLKWAKAVSR